MPAKATKQTRLLMGMPITIEIVGSAIPDTIFSEVYSLLSDVDRRFSSFKSGSEVTKINQGLPRPQWSREMKRVLELCEQTKRQTHGYFDAWHEDKLDPSGLVKGWAISRAAQLLHQRDFHRFCIEAGGDIQVSGRNAFAKPWRVGIRRPAEPMEIIKVVQLETEGIATSGAYIRGQHIYNPHKSGDTLETIASMTVIGPDIYEADRFATAAYAMSAHNGARFIESLPGFEAYAITSKGTAILTSGFDRYTLKP